MAVAGTVDALGEGVSDVDEGAAVWGHLAYSTSQRQASFAEYITAPRQTLATKPDGVSFEVAAAAATVAMTSLQAPACPSSRMIRAGAGHTHRGSTRSP
jgi:NADPH:quinone reductase-like Zn-dependent oxidoreductase